MGLKEFFKRFSKTISLHPSCKDDFIIPVKLKGGFIIIDSKISVDANHAAVIVCKDKPLEVFREGEHTLSLAVMPRVTKEMKLGKGKVVKSGRTATVILPKKFRGDIYYVNLNEFKEIPWETAGGVEVKSKTFGRFTYDANGLFSFAVTDPVSAIRLFLIDWAYIKPGRAIKKIRYYIGETTAEAFHANKLNEPMQLLNKEVMSRGLAEKVRKTFGNYGIEIKFFSLSGVTLPKDIAEKLGVMEQAVIEAREAAENNLSETEEYFGEKEEEVVLENNQDTVIKRSDGAREKIPFYDAVLGSGGKERSEFSKELERLQSNFDSKVAQNNVDSGIFFGSAANNSAEERLNIVTDVNDANKDAPEYSKPPLFDLKDAIVAHKREQEFEIGCKTERGNLQEAATPPDSMHENKTENGRAGLEENANDIDIDALLNKPGRTTNARRRGLPLCSGCGEILPVGVWICPKCGKNIIGKKQKVCPMCKKENPPDAQFCSCGCFLP